MTVRVLLVRHGTHDLLGKVLCGRMENVPLNGGGLAQAGALGARLAAEQPRGVFSSPVLRAQQTAMAIAARCGCMVRTESALEEIDVGDWTGKAFDALTSDPAWEVWNRERDTARPPGGETMREVQARVTQWLQRMSGERDGLFVAVSHADVIKAACCDVLGIPFDRIHRFDVDPCSVTEMQVADWGMRVGYLNRI